MGPTPHNDGKTRAQATDLRLTVPCDRLGLAAPPADVHIKLVPLSQAGWRVFLWNHEGPAADLAPWLSQQTEASFQRRVRERLSVYAIPELPDGWKLWEMPFDVTACRLWRSGEATLQLHGKDGELRSFAAGLGARDVPAGSDGPPPASGDPQPAMTDRQHTAAAAALSEGYFEVPRRIRLQDLAENMGTSVGGLSETLRRAQANLLEAYLEAHPAPEIPLDTWPGAA